MTDVKQLITEYLDIWLTAETEKKSGRGRSSGSNTSIYGVQKLRELILDLAFTGKLVSHSLNQNFNFIEQIDNEQKELVKAKILKKTTSVKLLDKENYNYFLPSSWILISLADVGYNLGQKNPDQKFTYIDVSAVNSLSGKIENPTVLERDEAPSRARKRVDIGTVIYSTIRPYLNNIAVIDSNFEFEPIASTAFAVIHPYKIVNSLYLFYYLRSPIFVEYVESQQIGIAYPAINDKQFFSGAIPLPPPEEQQRIVAKVDELMQLCDQLEQQQNLSTKAHEQLVDLLLNALTNSADADEFQQNWQRISANFDLLFTTDYSIEQLKQTILQLAIMGKLVKQDPSDEPASELLKQIAEEKAKLVKDGKIKKSKPLPEITDDEKPFELPEGWILERLNNILDVRDGTHDTPKYVEKGFPLVTSKNLSSGKLELENTKYISEEDHLEISRRSKVDKNDILFAMIGSIGNPVIVDTEIQFSIKNVALFKPYTPKFYNMHYFLLVFHILSDQLKLQALGAVQSFVSLNILRSQIIALPPLKEQKRIVEKVDQLFSIIDQLRVLQTKARQTQLHLADVLVANAVEAG